MMVEKKGSSTLGKEMLENRCPLVQSDYKWNSKSPQKRDVYVKYVPKKTSFWTQCCLPNIFFKVTLNMCCQTCLLPNSGVNFSKVTRWFVLQVSVTRPHSILLLGTKRSFYTLQGTNISYLGKRKIIFKMPFFEGYVSSLEGTPLEDERLGNPCPHGGLVPIIFLSFHGWWR